MATDETVAHVTVNPHRQLHPGSVVTVKFTDDYAMELPIRTPDRDLAAAVNDALAQIGWTIHHLPDPAVVDEDGRLWFTAREDTP